VVVSIQIVHTIVAARTLPPVVFGSFAISLTIVQLLGYLVTAGVAATIVRSTLPDKELMPAVLAICTANGIAMAGVVWVLAPVLGNTFGSTTVVESLHWLAFLPLASALAAYFVSRLRRRGRYMLATSLEAMGLSFGLMGSVVLLILGVGVISMAAGLIAGQALIAMSALASGGLVRGRSRLQMRPLAEMGYFVLHVGSQNLCHFFLYNLPLWLLGLTAPGGVVGQYARAWNLVTLPTTQAVLATTKTMQASFPRVHRSEAPDRLSTYTVAVITFARRMILPAAVASALVAPELIPWLLGGDWAAAGKLVPALALFALLNVIYTLLASAAESYRLMKRVWLGILAHLLVFAALYAVCMEVLGTPVVSVLVSLTAGQGAALIVHLIAAKRDTALGSELISLVMNTFAWVAFAVIGTLAMSLVVPTDLAATFIALPVIAWSAMHVLRMRTGSAVG
jgi:PST family polysaccharide transporter